MTAIANSKFFVREFDGASYGEKQWLYDLPENNLCEDLEDAYAKATFSFEDAGSVVKRVSNCEFSCDGREYKVFLEEGV